MSIKVIEEIEAFAASLRAKYAPEVKKAENDIKAIGHSALHYIETNGLKDLYGIAMSVLAGAATGTPWMSILSTVVTQGEAAGIAIAKGSEAVVVAQAQADLIAAGALASPSTGSVVAVNPTASGS